MVKNKIKFLFILFFFFLTILKTQSQNDYSTESYSTQFTNEASYFSTEQSTQEQIDKNFCKELYPFCFCGISSIILQCRNFTKFSELNFSLLKNSSDQSPRKIYELELEPLSPIPFDRTLNLDGISLYGRAILNKLSKLDLNANPFESVKENNNLNLYLYDVNLETSDLDAVCQSNMTSNYTSLFSSFGYVFFSESTYTKSGNLCPLIFKNANLRKFEIYSFNSNSEILFSSIDDEVDLNATITDLTIHSAKNFSLDLKFLNPRIFQKLTDLNFDYVELESIQEGMFENFTHLRKFSLDLTKMSDFIRKTDNKWMSSLNFDLKPVNYSNSNEIANFQNRTLVITFNSRNGQDYSFPDEDLEFFKYFPHDKLVYARILVDQNLKCSDTLRFVLKNAFSYPTESFLNTTSTYKCFLSSSGETTQTSYEAISQTTNIPETTVSNAKISTKESNTGVSLGAYLGTTIPLAVISILSLLCAIYFFSKLKKIGNINDTHIELF